MFEILGEIPSLLVLNLVTAGGTSGRIFFPGNKGFRSLKYFSLCIQLCETSLEFEVGSMSKLEHIKLEFNAHEMECLNGASTLGIQHLSSLHKVEIKIRGYRLRFVGNYNPAQDDHDDTVRCISRAIIAAIETLPNRPTARFKRGRGPGKHFESYLREWDQYREGLLNEWLKLWQIREEQEATLNEWLKLWQIREEQEATNAETEQEVDTHENEEEEQTDEDEETSEKEVAQQDDSGSSN